MNIDPNKARSKLQTMTTSALIKLADRHGVDLIEKGRIVSNKRKVAILMQCESVVEELGAKG